MTETVAIGEYLIGLGHPTFIIAEIGINHNGEMANAKKLIDAAVLAGCDAVKFQKRTPELCVPRDQWDVERDTPWGRISYIDYRRRIEFSLEEYAEIDRYCREKEILWFASCWDEEAVDFVAQFDPVCYKIASASLTDHPLLAHINSTGKPVILSTGMSTMKQIRTAVEQLNLERLVLAHSTSCYPCLPGELNLRMIPALQAEFDCPIGYSGHEVGLQTSCAAVTLGASFIERHITLDRTLWGSDQAASVEPWGFMRLVRDIRVIEEALGDGVKQIYESEASNMRKLRRAPAANDVR